MTDLLKLKSNLLETQFPFFTDADLQNLLDEYPDVKTATYFGLMTKAQDDSVSLGPIKTPSNEKFWLRRARLFRTNKTGVTPRVDEVISD